MPRAAISVATKTRTAPDLEILQRTQPLVLRSIRMDRPRRDPGSLEFARDLICAPLCSGKNENGIELRIGEKMKQQRRL